MVKKCVTRKKKDGSNYTNCYDTKAPKAKMPDIKKEKDRLEKERQRKKMRAKIDMMRQKKNMRNKVKQRIAINQ